MKPSSPSPSALKQARDATADGGVVVVVVDVVLRLLRRFGVYVDEGHKPLGETETETRRERERERERGGEAEAGVLFLRERVNPACACCVRLGAGAVSFFSGEYIRCGEL